MSREHPFWICLQQQQRMQEVQKELDAPEWYDAQFTGCDAIVPRLNTLLTDVEDLPRINELAQVASEIEGKRAAYKIQGGGRCDAV